MTSNSEQAPPITYDVLTGTHDEHGRGGRGPLDRC